MGRGVKTRKIVLNESGYFLSRKKGCFVVSNIRTKKEVAKYPILEKRLGEIQVISGNLISTGALVTAAFNRIPVIIKTALGSPVGILWSIDDYSHVDTRLFQFATYQNIQALEIVKEIVLAKIKGQNEVLKKYGLRRIDFSVIEKVNDTYLYVLTEKELKNYIKNDKFPKDGLERLRAKLVGLEGRTSRYYFKEIFQLFPVSFRPKSRRGFKAYDGLNNTFNLAYRILFFKVMTALIKARLEPCLGFYHTIKFGEPSLVCDFMEIYRYLIDDFLIDFCRKLGTKDFVFKDDTHAGVKGKRAFLNKKRNKEFLDRLEEYFRMKVSIPRPRVKRGKRQELETLINEEAQLFARFIRCKRKSWIPRIVTL